MLQPGESSFSTSEPSSTLLLSSDEQGGRGPYRQSVSYILHEQMQRSCKSAHGSLFKSSLQMEAWGACVWSKFIFKMILQRKLLVEAPRNDFPIRKSVCSSEKGEARKSEASQLAWQSTNSTSLLHRVAQKSGFPGFSPGPFGSRFHFLQKPFWKIRFPSFC